MFYVPFCRTNYSLNAPINRMCTLANNCNVFDVNFSNYSLKKNLRCGWCCGEIVKLNLTYFYYLSNGFIIYLIGVGVKICFLPPFLN